MKQWGKPTAESSKLNLLKNKWKMKSTYFPICVVLPNRLYALLEHVKIHFLGDIYNENNLNCQEQQLLSKKFESSPPAFSKRIENSISFRHNVFPAVCMTFTQNGGKDLNYFFEFFKIETYFIHLSH